MVGRRRALFRGGAAQGSPEFVESGIPGLVLACGLVWELVRLTRNPLRHSTGRCGAGRGILADMGGSAVVEKRRRAWPGHLGCVTRKVV